MADAMRISIYLLITNLFFLCRSLENETDTTAFTTILTYITDDNYRSWNTISTTIPPPLEEICPYSSCSDNTTNVYMRNFQRGCHCDNFCVEIRDCCEDSILYNEVEQQKPPTLECERISRSQLFIKNTCSPSWDDADTETLEKCNFSRKRRLNIEDVELSVPVTSVLSNATYGNVYCAICNYEEEFIMWNLTIRDFCRSYPVSKNDMVLAELQNSADLKFDGRVWYFMINESTFICDLEIEVPNSIKLNYCSNEKIINSCMKNWSDASILKQCEGAYAKVYDYSGYAYKNRYCAYCNGLNDSELLCVNVVQVTRMHSGIDFHFGGHRPLTVLFDFKLKKPNLKKCDQNSTDQKNQTLQNHICLMNSTEIKSKRTENWFFTGYTSIAILISLLLLIVHLIVFSNVKELQTIGGRCLASFCLALVLAYSSFLLGNHLKGDICVAMAVITYYSFLSAFSWMFTISFDMWKTFWNATKKFRSPQNSKIRFLIYSIWSWTIPGIAALVTLYFDLAKTHPKLAPHFGENGCWFQNGYSLLFFFVAPVSVIILVNFFLFLHTSFLLYSNQCESVNQKSRVDFKLFARIGLLTGFTWITGFIAGYTQKMIIWFLFIFLNTAQGIFIFSAFTCKKRIILSFFKKLGIFKNWQTTLQTNNTTFTALSTESRNM